MPNTLITPMLLSRQALGFWQESQVLCGLFNRAYESEFGGGTGDTVTIKQQASLTATLFNRANGVVAQDITETAITVTVSDLYDVSVEITQEQWDFDVDDFGWQVAEPAGRALARQAETLIANQLATQTAPAEMTLASPIKAIIDARKTLNDSEVPIENRFIVVGTSVAATLLGDDHFLKANEAGSDQALRSAQIGRVMGMDVYESVVVADDEAYVCHKDALTFVSIVPTVARGTTEGAISTFDGLGLRTVFGYDQNLKQDLVSFDSYYEVAPLRGNLAYKRILLEATP